MTTHHRIDTGPGRGSALRTGELEPQFLLDTLLQSTLDFVYFKDRESRYVAVSDELVRLFGAASADEILGKRDLDLVSERFPHEAALASRAEDVGIMASGFSVVDNEEGRPQLDGSLRWVSVTKMPLRDAGGEVIGVWGVSRDVTRSREAREELSRQSELNEYQSLHDALTGLPNRRLYQDRVEQAVLAAERDGSIVATLLADLDRFKEINDMLGHHSGDELLQTVAGRMRAVLRAQDTIARLGGDEFGVLLTGLRDPDDVLPIIDELARAIGGTVVLQGLPVAVECSIGVALYPRDGIVPERLLHAADVAMYCAKRDYRTHAFYEIGRDAYDPGRLTLVGELRRAIDEDEFVLHYQPKARLGGGGIGGVEALLRWQHPTRGLVMPDEFIPQATETSLMKPLTLYVLRAALAQCREWREQGIELEVSINVSTRNLLDVEFPDEVRRALEEAGVEPRFLQLEITEETMLEDPRRTRIVTEELNELGVRIAIDDFGTGYSSLAYLKDLPIHELKIDRSFVMNMDRVRDDRVIVECGIALGQRLGYDVTAEGVENESVWRMLRDLGCDIAQGYYLARPVPSDELVAWLQATDIAA